MSDLTFLIVYNILLSVLNRLSGMPLLIYCATVCPASIENSLYAFMMSWINTTADIGSFLGSWLLKEYNITPKQFNGLDQLVLLRSICSLLPLLGLALLPTSEDQVEEELEGLLSSEELYDDKEKDLEKLT